MTHANYTVGDIEQFNLDNYKDAVKEIFEIREGTKAIADIFKADILISFWSY